MAGANHLTLRALRSFRRMPLPSIPQVRDYGAEHVGEGHNVVLFPAIVRDTAPPEVDTIIEEGQSSCFFHPKLPATNVCEMSGRLICDLCQTEWNGQVVSFEALQSVLKKGSPGAPKNQQVRWDNIALSLAILPLFFWLLTIVTAPVALFIVVWQGRKGGCSVVQRSGRRYLIAGGLALLQIAGWLLLLISGIG